MLTALKPWMNKSTGEKRGFYLIWLLFPSIVMVMAITFIAVQFLSIAPDSAALSLSERMDLGRLAREASDNLPFMLLLVILMMTGVLVTLHLGLRPLRQISERAARIGPATIGERLSLQAAPGEIRPLVLAFNGALDRLEAGLRAQQEFSANAAHELRTPLATLRAQVESLLAPDERKDAIEEFDRLSRLIAQLLALAEADSGKALAKGPFDLVDVARSLASDMAGTILANGRSISFESAHQNWECHGAVALVQIALRNLLENAMRHTPPGTEIMVSVEVQGQLAVSDDGPGIPAMIQGRLFQRFSKADSQGSGAGLGLSIVSRVMMLHGGDARLDTTNTGARFVLDFSKRGGSPHSSVTASQRSKSAPGPAIGYSGLTKSKSIQTTGPAPSKSLSTSGRT
ncbi:ATP-binding protein [Hyphomonas sp. BRH_c22]|uniref:ATP-binding protein n=1 Tax=Hyphomonas sp. BRH_c22 TaxID=1629710 RepID=UPI000A48F374|nr:ATP-binding protein [Hyphomonas sp. BRH_c22]